MASSCYFVLGLGVGQTVMTDNNYLYFECVLTEQQERSATITEHPVEDGANIADHYRTDLDRLTLECFLSNQPIDTERHGIAAFYGGSIRPATIGSTSYRAAADSIDASLQQSVPIQSTPQNPANVPQTYTAQTLQFSNQFDRVADLITILELLRSNARVIDVVTANAFFEHMAVEKYEIKRDKSTGAGAMLTISLKSVLVVTTASVNAPTPKVVQHAPPVPKGAQQPKPATAPKTSGLKAIVNGVRSFI